MANYCERGDELSVFIKFGEFLSSSGNTKSSSRTVLRGTDLFCACMVQLLSA